MLCLATPAIENMKIKIHLTSTYLPTVASACSIMTKHICYDLSALQRLTTTSPIRGSLGERENKT